MPARVVHKLNRAQIQMILKSPFGPVARDMMRRGTNVSSKAKQNLSSSPMRVDTGRLRSDIHAELVIYNGKPAVRVGTNVAYARFVHDGTGIYGPRAQMIRPKSKKILRWKARSGQRSSKGGYVFAREVRGMRPNPFLTNALSAARG